jgi:hypothetical protein
VEEVVSSDPFVTPTVARIYAQQGRLTEAKVIYQKLLADAPNDHALRRELDELERKLAAGPADAPSHTDQVTIEPLGEEQLRCRWTITAQGADRARMVLGSAEGILNLRVVGFPLDPELGIRDTALTDSRGVITVPPPAGADLVAASVGLLSGDGTFVSIAHCDMVDLQ